MQINTEKNIYDKDLFYFKKGTKQRVLWHIKQILLDKELD